MYVPNDGMANAPRKSVALVATATGRPVAFKAVEQATVRRKCNHILPAVAGEPASARSKCAGEDFSC
jgi:hypothetical protein